MFVPAEATILHADADAFFASVEQRDDPALRGRPVAVGPGVVMAASYEAKAFGVRGGMHIKQARRLCPEIVAVPSRFDAYVAASRDLFEVFRRTAPVVEGLSMEEAFLDVRGLDHIRGSPPEVSRRLRAEVREEVGLAVSVGLATSKVVAKMASAAAKPDGLLHIAPGEEREFLHPLPIERVWGVGKASATRLRRHGIATVGDVAAVSEDALAAILGRAHGARLHAIAAGGQFRPVRSGRGRRSFGAQRAIGLRHYARGDLERSLDALVDRVTRRMRKAHRVGRTVILRMRFGDFARASRSYTLHAPTAETLPIQEAARALLTSARPVYEPRGLTMVGVTVTNVEPDGGGIQLRLPVTRANEALDAALDELRDRYGATSITRATNADHRPELAADLLAGEEESRN
jgi:DNA polymerase-4